MTGLATTDDILKDSVFGIETNALKLSRTVEMFQWQEKSHPEPTQNVGGSDETTETTYTYEKGMVFKADKLNLPSSSPPGTKIRRCPTPVIPYRENHYTWRFTLAAPFTGNWATGRILRLPTRILMPQNGGLSSFRVIDGRFFRGNASNPQIGALRVSFESILPQTVTVVGLQQGATVETYKAKNGTINLLPWERSRSGDVRCAEAENKIITWIIRFAGFCDDVDRPFALAGTAQRVGQRDSVPWQSAWRRYGLCLVRLCVVLTFVTAAIAWIVFRPVIGLRFWPSLPSSCSAA